MTVSQKETANISSLFLRNDPIDDSFKNATELNYDIESKKCYSSN